MCKVSQEVQEARENAALNGVYAPYNTSFEDSTSYVDDDYDPYDLNLVDERADDKKIITISVPPELSKHFNPSDSSNACPDECSEYNIRVTGKICPNYDCGYCRLQTISAYSMCGKPRQPYFEFVHSIRFVIPLKADIPASVKSLAEGGILKSIEPGWQAILLSDYDEYFAAKLRYDFAHDRYLTVSQQMSSDDPYYEWYMKYAGSITDLDILKHNMKYAQHVYYGDLEFECEKLDGSNWAYDMEYTDDELAKGYEEAQYRERLKLGEPVVFEHGRCLFESYVINAGYRPGPFPGLQFYVHDNQYVDPTTFAEWLEHSLPERRMQTSMPPVSYCGFPACRRPLFDILRFYYKHYGVFGPKTFQLFKESMPDTWVHCP